MIATREQVFTALWTLTNNVSWLVNGVPTTFASKSRRLQLFSDVSAQPWVGQAEHGDTLAQITNQPYKKTYEAIWFIYHRAGDNPNAIPSITTNLICDAVEAAFAPVPADPGFLDRRNTLQGLVHHCFISGTIFKDPGDIDNQGFIRVPIKVLVP